MSLSSVALRNLNCRDMEPLVIISALKASSTLTTGKRWGPTHSYYVGMAVFHLLGSSKIEVDPDVYEFLEGVFGKCQYNFPDEKLANELIQLFEDFVVRREHLNTVRESEGRVVVVAEAVDHAGRDGHGFDRPPLLCGVRDKDVELGLASSVSNPLSYRNDNSSPCSSTSNKSGNISQAEEVPNLMSDVDVLEGATLLSGMSLADKESEISGIQPLEVTATVEEENQTSMDENLNNIPSPSSTKSNNSGGAKRIWQNGLICGVCQSKGKTMTKAEGTQTDDFVASTPVNHFGRPTFNRTILDEGVASKSPSTIPSTPNNRSMPSPIPSPFSTPKMRYLARRYLNKQQ